MIHNDTVYHWCIGVIIVVSLQKLPNNAILEMVFVSLPAPIAIKHPPPISIDDKIQICGGVASVQLHSKITLHKQRKIVRPLA